MICCLGLVKLKKQTNIRTYYAFRFFRFSRARVYTYHAHVYIIIRLIVGNVYNCIFIASAGAKQDGSMIVSVVSGRVKDNRPNVIQSKQFC